MGARSASALTAFRARFQRAFFQGVTQAEQEEQQRAFGEGAQHGRAERRDHHQEIGVEMPLAEGVPGVAGDIPPAKDVGADVEHQADRLGQAQERFARPADQHKQPGGQAEEQFPILLEPAPQASGRDGVAQRTDTALDSRLIDLLAVELDADALGSVVDADRQHTVQAADGVLQDGHAVGTVHPLDRQMDMVEAIGDLCAGSLGQPLHPFQRHQVRVVVQANQRLAVCALHMRLLDPLLRRQLLVQALHTTIAFIGDPWQQYRDFKLKRRFSHHASILHRDKPRHQPWVTCSKPWANNPRTWSSSSR